MKSIIVNAMASHDSKNYKEIRIKALLVFDA